MGEFIKFMFQPPVLILFALAVAGLSDLLAQRADHRVRVDMEWRVRETFYRREAGFGDELIARARKMFYAQRYLKEPKK